MAQTTLSPYGLLYVSDKRQDGANLKSNSAESRIRIYLKMAIRLGRGLKRSLGVPLTVITNKRDFLLEQLAALGFPQSLAAIEVLELPFTSNLPEEAEFFSSSHKVLLFDYFATRPNYSLLLDLDIICLPGVHGTLDDFVASGTPMCYDISDQVIPAYGYDRISDDLKQFGTIPRSFRWYGGEFIGGTASFFSILKSLSGPAVTVYSKVYDTLHHQGDEMITSYCLNRLVEDHPDIDLVNVGALDLLRRHWGKPTRHDEKRFSNIQEVRFLHLPALKGILCSGLSDDQIVRLLKRADLSPRYWSRHVLGVSTLLARRHPFRVVD